MCWKKSKMQVQEFDSDDDTDTALMKKVATKVMNKGMVKKILKQR